MYGRDVFPLLAFCYAGIFNCRLYVFQKKEIFFFQKTFKYYIIIWSQASPTPAIAMRPLAICTIIALTRCSLDTTHVAFEMKRQPKAAPE